MNLQKIEIDRQKSQKLWVGSNGVQWVQFAIVEEYLHACSDDLVEWERNLALDAPVAVRKKIEAAWVHWYRPSRAHFGIQKKIWENMGNNSDFGFEGV